MKTKTGVLNTETARVSKDLLEDVSKYVRDNKYDGVPFVFATKMYAEHKKKLEEDNFNMKKRLEEFDSRQKKRSLL